MGEYRGKGNHGITEEVSRLTNSGPSQITSPGGSSYIGPVMSEVAKTIKSVQDANRNPEKALVT